MIRQFGDQVDGECDVFRRGSHPAAVTLPIVEPYPLAELVLIHSRPHLIDDPGTVAVDDDSWVFHGGRATPSISVRRIDAGSLQLHPHLAVAGVGRGQFAADQDFVRRSLSVVPDCAYSCLPQACLGSQPTFSNFCSERMWSGRGVSG